MPSGLSRLEALLLAVSTGPAALASGLMAFKFVAGADTGSSLQAPKPLDSLGSDCCWVMVMM